MHNFANPVTYKTPIRPILNVYWDPYYQCDITILESVQRRATKLVNHLPHVQRLRHLQLPSLSYYWYKDDMITVYKILNDIYAVNPQDFVVKSPTISTRGHRQKVHKHYEKSNP